MTNQILDKALDAIPFYQTHWYMKPFIGKNYISSKHKKLLIVGESHYMPECSTVHHDVDKWYGTCPKLTVNEEKSCDTRGARGCVCRGYGKELNRVIKKIAPFAGLNAFEEAASCNYFLRPADYKRSFKELCTQKDREISIKTFMSILDILKPDTIVFTSEYAFNFAEWDDYPKYFKDEGLWVYTNAHNMVYTFTLHPSCSWWNRVVKKKTGSSDDYFHGMTSRQYFCDFLKKNWLY